MKNSKALLGAGCFWGVEEKFRNINGVKNTKVGYAGGDLINPTYQEVCLGNTGHAEVVLIEFDTNQISFHQILENFWLCHDPTQLNKQGFDIGNQYRSVIFYYNEKQKNIAVLSKENYQKKLSNQIVTEITKVTNFYSAENYHQKYIQKRS